MAGTVPTRGRLWPPQGNFKLAEKHYVEAQDWGSAVNMYRANDAWDDAIRVAKLHGGVNASKKVAYAWAVSLGGEAVGPRRWSTGDLGVPVRFVHCFLQCGGEAASGGVPITSATCGEAGDFEEGDAVEGLSGCRGCAGGDG